MARERSETEMEIQVLNYWALFTHSDLNRVVLVRGKSGIVCL
jgi:hypothetical protein